MSTSTHSGDDALLDSAPCGFLTFTDDGIVGRVNRTLLDMLGTEREALVGHHVEKMFTVGTRIFYQTHFFPLLRLHGRAEEVFLMLRNAAGEEVGALVNAHRLERDGVWVTDCVLMQVRERRKFEDALIRAKAEAEAAHREAEARTQELRLANEQLQAQAVELEMSQQQLSEQATELEAQSEELQATNDELMERSIELERLRSVADDANHAKSAFLAAMSHELRTPLNAIGGYAQLLEMGVLGPIDPSQHEALEKITRSQRHLLRLINEVLNLSRIEAGAVNYDLQPLDVAQVVRDVLPMAEPQIAEGNLALELDLAPNVTARGDREKTAQILLNLLGNAVKFTPAGGSVRVRSSLDPRSARRVVLAVTDTGIGIDAGQLDSIFEPFVQVDVSLSGRAKGTGLGLSISRDLARGMGGELTAVSEAGKGSTFTLALPSA